MGALSKEYLYKLLEEENREKHEDDMRAYKNNLYKKIIGGSQKALTPVLGQTGGALTGAMLPGIGASMAKVNITGNVKNATEYSNELGGALSASTIQALGVTPYLLTQMSKTHKNIADIRNRDNQFLDNNDFAKYGSGAQFVHGMDVFKNVATLASATGAGTAALAGQSGLASTLAHGNAFSALTHGSSAILGKAFGLTGLSAAAPGLLGLMALGMITNKFNSIGKPKNNTRLTAPMTVSGAQLLYSKSTYNQHINTITLLQSQNLLEPKDALMLSILNDINLNTTPLRLEYMDKMLNEKEYHNTNARNRLFNLYDPYEEEDKNKKMFLTEDTDGTDDLEKDSEGRVLNKREISDRKSIYTALTATGAMTNLAISAALGPLSALFTGKTYGSTRESVLNLLAGNHKNKLLAHKKAKEFLKLPSSLMTALYSPVTKWLDYETPETQQLAILANMHEIVRSGSLSLLSINKSLGSDKPGSRNIYSLLEDLEEEFENDNIDTKDYGIAGKYLGPILGHIVDPLLKGVKHSFNGGMGLLKLGGQALALPFHPFYDSEMKADSAREFKENLKQTFELPLSIYEWAKEKKKYVKNKDTVFGKALMKRMGYVSDEKIEETYLKNLKESGQYSKRDSAYAFLSDHFPDLTMKIYQELRQQTLYMEDSLNCQGCEGRTLRRTTKKWRGTEGKFMDEKSYHKLLHSNALDKTKEDLNADDLLATSMGNLFSWGFFKTVLGVNKEDFRKQGEKIIDLAKYQEYEEEKKKKKGKGKGNRSRGSGESDEELQEDLKKTSTEEAAVRRDRLKIRLFRSIEKNTRYNIRIFDFMKKCGCWAGDCCGDCCDDCGPGDSGGPSGGIDINRRSRGKKSKNKKPRRSRNVNVDERNKNKNKNKKPGNKNSGKKPKGKSSRFSRVAKIGAGAAGAGAGFAAEEISSKTHTFDPKGGISNIDKSKVKTVEESVEKAGKSKSKWKIFFRILKNTFRKKGAAALIKKIAVIATASLVAAPETLGVSAIIGIIVSVGSTVWDISSFLYDAFEEYKDYINKVETLEKQSKMNSQLHSGNMSEEDFQKLLNDSKKFKPMIDYDTFSGNDAKFDINSEDKMLNMNTGDYENFVNLATKYKKWNDDDDSANAYKFLMFKKFLDKHQNIKKEVSKGGSDNIDRVFKEFISDRKTFNEEFMVKQAETTNNLHVASINGLNAVIDSLKGIGNILLSNNKKLDNIVNAITEENVKIVSLAKATIK